jgi:hypothetical protein
MNDTEAQRAADTEWMPERNYDLADADRARIANRCRRRPGVRQIGKRDEGEIVIAVARNHSCLDHDAIHALDERGITATRREDVLIRHHQASSRRRPKHAGADAVIAAAARVNAHGDTSQSRGEIFQLGGN